MRGAFWACLPKVWTLMVSCQTTWSRANRRPTGVRKEELDRLVHVVCHSLPANGIHEGSCHYGHLIKNADLRVKLQNYRLTLGPTRFMAVRESNAPSKAVEYSARYARFPVIRQQKFNTADLRPRYHTQLRK